MRLIDADRLKEYIDAQKGRPFIGCTIGEALKIMTDEQPTVDAVPVRCKDCKNNPLKTWFGCPMAHLPFNGDRWCWKGEREDGGGNG